MAERNDDRMPEAKMDASSLFREEVYTDRRIGTIRALLPIKPDGSPDTARDTVYVGEAQIYTNMGALPLSFEIDAKSLEQAVKNYAPAAKEAIERAVREIEEVRRQAASSIVIPRGGAGGLPPGALGGGGGKIQLP
ncbi:MAG: hypothetical protein C5B46_06260 [Proteobacteria bacterium]|nr:MAG: hypothetical protein C5B46_06260 [Pseudomonadota bacterium]